MADLREQADMSERMCKVPGCGRPVGPSGAKGMCPTHYHRSQRGADLLAPVQSRNPAAGLPCPIEDCGKPVKARGLCDTHYMRWWSHGDPQVVHSAGWRRWGDPEIRFWTLVDKREDGCWLWLGHRVMLRGGYGVYRGRYAHRVAYEMLVGPIPDGLTIDHLCRNPPCVNPAHLEPVTLEENSRRSPLWTGNRTHCPAGHPYDEANTYIGPTKGDRRCRACNRARKQGVT